MGQAANNSYMKKSSYGDPRLVTRNYCYPVTRIPGNYNTCIGLQFRYEAGRQTPSSCCVRRERKTESQFYCFLALLLLLLLLLLLVVVLVLVLLLLPPLLLLLLLCCFLMLRLVVLIGCYTSVAG